MEWAVESSDGNAARRCGPNASQAQVVSASRATMQLVREHPHARTIFRLRSTALYIVGPPVPGPSRLCRFAHDFASLFGADMSPARSAKADRRSVNRFGRELSAGNIEEFDREVQEDFRGKACVPHDAPETRSPPGAEYTRKLGGECLRCGLCV